MNPKERRRKISIDCKRTIYSINPELSLSEKLLSNFKDKWRPSRWSSTRSDRWMRILLKWVETLSPKFSKRTYNTSFESQSWEWFRRWEKMLLRIDMSTSATSKLSSRMELDSSGLMRLHSTLETWNIIHGLVLKTKLFLFIKLRVQQLRSALYVMMELSTPYSSSELTTMLTSSLSWWNFGRSWNLDMKTTIEKYSSH